MKIILKIARKELQLLFYSPVAWIMLLLLMIQTAMLFTGKYATFLGANEYGNGVIPGVSMGLFVMGGVWSIVYGYLYYYIPLLTMGLVSKELSSGSIKLLYSSPLTNAQIILGKFVSMVIYAFVMCLLLSLYVIVAGFTVPFFEWQVVLVGLFGLFLLTCTYISVGIFISSLTTYQFVAAVGTFLTLMFLTYVGTWWQEYDLVRDITYWLSINGRATTFLGGMICSEDLLYFPLVTALFLSLTIIRLNAIRQKIPFFKTLCRNLVVIFVACFVGYLSSRPKLMAYYDASSTKWNTLTKQSQDIVSQLEGGLTITGYANVVTGTYYKVGFPYFIQKNRELFQLYERFKPEMKLKMVYYYDTITAQDDILLAEAFAKECSRRPHLTLWDRVKERCGRATLDSAIVKSPEEIRRHLDLTGEKTFVWHIKRENGDSTWLRLYDDLKIYPFEAEISAALKRLTMDYPKVAFVRLKGTRIPSDNSPQGYSMVAHKKSFRESLLNQGFDAIEIDLDEEIPSDIDILTLADWREAFTPRQEQVLRNYIERGGNLFVLGEPRRREIMNPWLRDLFGVELMEGTLVQYRRPDLAPDALCAIPTVESHKLSYYYEYFRYAVLPTVAGIEQVADKGFSFIPVLQTDTIVAELEKKEKRPYIVWNELENLNYLDEKMQCNPQIGEQARVYFPVVALTRTLGKKEQRIVITGDADCISTGELGQPRSSANLQLILGTFHYLSNNEMPVDIRRPQTKDNSVLINRTGYMILRTGFLYVLPFMLLGTGVFLWLRRRGR